MSGGMDGNGLFRGGCRIVGKFSSFRVRNARQDGSTDAGECREKIPSGGGRVGSDGKNRNGGEPGEDIVSSMV